MEHDVLPTFTPSAEPLLGPPDSVPELPPARLSSLKSVRLFLVGMIATVALGGVIFGTWAVYAFALTNPLVERIVSVVPFPAALVSGRPIRLSDFLFEYKSMRQYTSQNATRALVEEDYAVLRKNVLDALVRRVIVNRIALDEGVYLTKEAVAGIEESMATVGNSPEQLGEDIEKLFGWDIEQFRDHIVRPAALEKMLNERIVSDAQFQDVSRNLVERALERLQKGEAFTDVAKDVNEPGILPDDGALGKISASSVPLNVSEALKDLKDGEFTPVVEIGTQNDWAFYIIRLNGRGEEDGKPVMDLSVIRVKKTTLDDLVNQRLEKAFIWRIVS